MPNRPGSCIFRRFSTSLDNEQVVTARVTSVTFINVKHRNKKFMLRLILQYAVAIYKSKKAKNMAFEIRRKG